jgi:hypothetical protein
MEVFMKRFFLLLILCFSSLISCASIRSNTLNEKNNKAQIEITHGIIVDNAPGYSLSITNWEPNAWIGISIIDQKGKTLSLIDKSQNVLSDANGCFVIDISYLYGNLNPGECTLALSGKKGIIIDGIEYPLVQPPTENNPEWNIYFMSSQSK